MYNTARLYYFTSTVNSYLPIFGVESIDQPRQPTLAATMHSMHYQNVFCSNQSLVNSCMQLIQVI